MKLDVQKIRQLNPQIVCLGSHRGIIQSMLDFDYSTGRTEPSIVGIVASGHKTERYYFGRREIMLKVYPDLGNIPQSVRSSINFFLNVFSGRRVLASSREALDKLPNLVGGVVFAEGMPERHAIDLYADSAHKGIWVLGAASVGLVVPAIVKLGAIGGTQASQLDTSRLFTPGSVAVISSSGGMVNEIIRTVARSGHSLSFALALGGERFPMLTPKEAFEAAEADPETKTIAYFGELGGQDEYLLVEMLRSGQITKPVISYIAGKVAELFETPPQFGHAKAMATRSDESAGAKAKALRAAGAHVANDYGGFVSQIESLSDPNLDSPTTGSDGLIGRSSALFASSISGDEGDVVRVLDQDLLVFAESNAFARIAVSMFLGHEIKSIELEEFVDFVLRLLVDHGPYVSGAVNTMIAARAGKDLVASLASGLLTIGPRFGGAINEAASTWLAGATGDNSPQGMVDEFAERREKIAGIGHRKYSADIPDPRVIRLLKFADKLEAKRFTSFARSVEAITVRKKSNLILNVDGAIAAILLDILSEKEGYSDADLRELVSTEFFNGLFVLSRSVGFMAHYFDQRRLDEGLFRLSPSEVALLKPTVNQSDHTTKP